MSLFFFFFNKTRWGIAMKATSEDSEAAQLMGIPVKQVYRIVWVFAAIVGVISGVLLAPRMALLDTTMSYLGLKAFPAAILGGFGSIPGAVAGGIILGVIETVSMGTLSFHFEWIKEINDIIVWIVLIAVLMIRPDGLFGIAKVKRV
jgi:branched-chain amino acid transport system permease protein